MNSYRFKSMLCLWIGLLSSFVVVTAGDAAPKLGDRHTLLQEEPTALAFEQLGTISSLGYRRFDQMVIGDQRAYMTTEDNDQHYRLLSYDISDPHHPIQGGSLPLQTEPRRLKVNGTTAYILMSNYVVQIFDLSQLQSPVVLGSYQVPPASIQDIAVVGSVMYLTSSDKALRIVDMSDATNPKELGSYTGNPESFFEAIEVVDNRAYIASRNELDIVDVTDPTHPLLLGRHDVSLSLSSIQISGNLLFATSDSVVTIYDISDPSHLVRLSTYIVKGSFFGFGATDSFRSDDVLYDANGNLYAIDISDPTKPFLRGSTIDLAYAYQITVIGDLMYTLDIRGIEILRIVPDTVTTLIAPIETHLTSVDRTMSIDVAPRIGGSSVSLTYTRHILPTHPLPDNQILVHDFTLETTNDTRLLSTLTITPTELELFDRRVARNTIQLLGWDSATWKTIPSKVDEKSGRITATIDGLTEVALISKRYTILLPAVHR